MNPVICIELDDNTFINEVVAELVNGAGYHTAWTNQGEMLDLPFNCVWKPGVSDLHTAYGNATYAVAKVNARLGTKLKLTKCVVTNSTPWSSKTELNQK